MLKFCLKILLILSLSAPLWSADVRLPSFPYISGNTFRAYADFVFDETEECMYADDAKQVKDGDVIFVKTDYLDAFIGKIHPQIKSRYIIVSHNSDAAVDQRYESLLNSEKVIAWFGQNVENYAHPKLRPIPIGLANRQWMHGKVEDVDDVKYLMEGQEKSIWLYMNFRAGTYPTERTYVYNLFVKKPYCTSVAVHPDFRTYLFEVAKSKFVLSPRGNGLDCHRTWEALVMGSYPIVRTSSLDSLFEDLPVVIVQNWNEVTFGFLQKKWAEMAIRKYNMEKAYAPYWLRQIFLSKDK